LPAALVLGALLGWLLLDQRDLRFAVQAVVTTMICIGIAWQGFRLVDMSRADANHDAAPVAQLGLQHAMAWMTAFAVLLAIVRAMPMFQIYGSWQYMRGAQWAAMLTSGALLGMVLIVALWAALGRGRVWIRLPVMLLVGFACGCVSAVLYRIGDVGWEYMLYEPYWTLSYWTDYLLSGRLWGGRDQLSQFLFCGCFTVSALLLVRLLGYRLAKPTKTSG
jgi:hypothetical protein